MLIQPAIGYRNRDGVMTRRLKNLYVEHANDGVSQFIFRSRPGLVKTTTLGAGPIRCRFIWSGHSIVVSNTDVYYDNIRVGTVLGADLCCHAASDSQIVVVGDGKAYIVTSVSVTQITDPDLFLSICDVVFKGGRFVYFNALNSQFQWSALGDATTIVGTDFATADEDDSPRVGRAMGLLVDDIVMFMDEVTEWWSIADSGTAPFVRSPGRRYNKGIVARATRVFLDNTLYFLGSDKMIYRASSVAVKVSTLDIDALLESVDDLSLASAFGVVVGGHSFYVIYIPTKGSFALDVASGEWQEWGTWNKSRFRIQVADGDVLGDGYSGNLYSFDRTTYTDDTDPLERVLSAYFPLQAGSVANFNLHLQCARGVGLISGYGSAPVVEMRFTDNDYGDFSNWLTTTLGAMGDRTDNAKAIWTQLGAVRAPGRLYEFRCTDPVMFAPRVVHVNEQSP